MSIREQVMNAHRRASEKVGDILRAHNPDRKWVDQVAAAVTGTARNFGRTPSELARELVKTLEAPIGAVEGLTPTVRFSPSKRTYLWTLMKLTRQQRRLAARARAKG